MKNLGIILFSVLLTTNSYAAIEECGDVMIEQIITGPKHGVLLNITNNNCGNSGYVCIDIEGQYSAIERNTAAYSFALASYMAGKRVNIALETDKKPASCGGAYPVIYDVRTAW